MGDQFTCHNTFVYGAEIDASLIIRNCPDIGAVQNTGKKGLLPLQDLLFSRLEIFDMVGLGL